MMMIQSRMASSERIAEIAAKIISLRQLTEMTGFQTSRSQGDLLRPLTPDELSAVSEILSQTRGAVNV